MRPVRRSDPSSRQASTTKLLLPHPCHQAALVPPLAVAVHNTGARGFERLALSLLPARHGASFTRLHLLPDDQVVWSLRRSSQRRPECCIPVLYNAHLVMHIRPACVLAARGLREETDLRGNSGQIWAEGRSGPCGNEMGYA